jgi:cytochrome c
MRRRIVRHLAAAGCAAASAAAAACARGEAGEGGGRPTRFGVGRPATAQQVAALDRDVDTTGHGLPEGRGTVDEGAAVYAAKCASCHGARGEGQATYPKLVSPPPTGATALDSFPFVRDHKIPKTVGNYWPYATTLYDYLRHAMPYDRPGTLTPNETYALVAWLLAENAVVPRTAVMDARTLPAVRLPARARFVPDDRRGGPVLR